MEWNLANNASFGPHTPGGCTTCRGALTVSAGTYSRNVAYYIIAHAAKFLPPGSRHIASDQGASVYSAAFFRPDGKKVLIVLNEGNVESGFNIKYKGRSIAASIPGGGVATYMW